jgi:hypothetical protein
MQFSYPERISITYGELITACVKNSDSAMLRLQGRTGGRHCRARGARRPSRWINWANVGSGPSRRTSVKRPIVFSNESRDGCSDPEWLCDAVGTPFSSCSMALYGVSRVWGGLVANRSRPIRSTACDRIGAIAHSLPGGTPLGSLSRPLSLLIGCLTRSGTRYHPEAWHA